MMCTYGAAFKQLADMQASKDWQFVDEGKKGAPKWGYISTMPGSVLRIVVNSTRGQGSSPAAPTQATPDKKPTNVMLAYLKSYNGMGMAKFE